MTITIHLSDTPESKRSLSDAGSDFATPVAAGTPLSASSASALLIEGEKQQISKKDLLNRFDSTSGSANDMSFVDLSTMNDSSGSVSRNSDSVISINSTPEKLNIPSPAHNSDTLEEIVIISSEGIHYYST